MDRRSLGMSTAAVVLVAVMLLLAIGASAVAAFPSGRVNEQVTPPGKNAADVIPDAQRVRAATSGDAVQFASLQGFGDVRGFGVSTDYVATRDPASGAWATHGITPPQEPATLLETAVFGLESRYVGEFSSDLSHGVFLAKSLLGDTPNVAGGVNLYRRSDLLTAGAGAYQLLTDASTPQVGHPGGPGTPSPEPFVAAASADFSHVIFESTRNLTDDAVAAGLDTNELKLYEWTDGAIRLAGILPTSEGGGPTISRAGAGGASNRFYTNGTISQDGSRVIFTGPPSTFAGGVLYLRDDQGTPATGDDATVRVSASERTDCNNDPTCGGDGIPDLTPDPANPGGDSQLATYWAASSDGSKVFFTSSEQLTDDDTNGASDVYKYDLDAPAGSRLTRLSVDEEPGDGLNAGVTGVIGASADGSYVYFTVTLGQLVAGGLQGDPSNLGSGERIFLWHDDTLREVAAVNGGVELNRILGTFGWGGQPKWSRVTPDGKHLVFVTQGTNELVTLYGAQTEYDQGECNGFNLFGPCTEIYVYDAAADGGDGGLQCASCNPTGRTATADADFYTAADTTGFGVTGGSSHLNHVLSDNGRYVFFNSAERLDPDDQNGVKDPYVFDTFTGEVHLLSSGKGTSNSIFLDASADGRDAFFTTRDQLRSTDTDQSRDLYDARIGGVPDPGVPVDPVCVGDACRPPSVAQAGLIGPPSAESTGPDDVLAPSNPRAIFTVEPLADRQLRALARGDAAPLMISTSAAGTVATRVKARIAGKVHVIQAIRRTLARGATIRLHIRLAPEARRRLQRTGKLRLVITTTYSQVPTPRTMRVTLVARS